MNSIRRYNLYLLNICDILSIILSFAMSYIIRFFIMRDIVFDETRINNYILLLAIIIFAYIIYNYVYLYKQWNYLNRKTLEESLECCKMDLFVVSLVIIFLNFIKYNTLYSRIFEAIFFICFLCFSLISRSLLKRYINKTSFRLNNTEKLLIIGNYDNVFSFLNDLNNDYRYSPAGIILTDSKYNKVKDVDVIAGNDNFKEIPASFIYDSVLIIPDSKTDKLAEWINYFISAGKIVHLKLIEYDYAPVNKNIDVIGTTPIINYRMLEPMSKRQQILKRSLDIVFSLLLIIPVLILYIIVFVLTNLESPGSVIISRLRVGKNNNLFNQYRFRIYRLDAKKRIQQHKSPCTIIGSFLLFFHLDGAPMIINISTDSMSFIGPKAPNLVKYLNMSAQEKNILNIRPGVMGYWSVLSDPQQILKKEKTYIEQWSVIKDIAILFSTQLRYLFFKSLRYDGKEHQKEELAFIDQINKDNQPLSYEHNYIRERERERSFTYLSYLFIKRIFDIIISIIGIIIVSPIFLILSIIIIAQDGGTPFYRHSRIGLNGKRIKIYKFRSMKLSAADLENILTPKQLAQYQKEFKIDNDPRITKIGNFIRQTSIDELPQLFNILKGDLSLVGPRPIVEKECKEYGSDLAKFLSIKPGLTGYWQAYARNKATYTDGKRQKMELYYIDHQSLILDIKIIFRTFYAVIKKDGAQ